MRAKTLRNYMRSRFGKLVDPMWIQRGGKDSRGRIVSHRMVWHTRVMLRVQARKPAASPPRRGRARFPVERENGRQLR